MFFAASRVQSGHCPWETMYSTSKICWRMVEVKTWEEKDWREGGMGQRVREWEGGREGEGGIWVEAHLLLNRKLDSDTLGMRLRPYERGVYQSDLCQTLRVPTQPKHRTKKEKSEEQSASSSLPLSFPPPLRRSSSPSPSLSFTTDLFRRIPKRGDRCYSPSVSADRYSAALYSPARTKPRIEGGRGNESSFDRS